jgi:hypothetical protein
LRGGQCLAKTINNNIDKIWKVVYTNRYTKQSI